MSTRKESITASFNKAKNKARSVLQDQERVTKLLETSKEKIRNLDLGENELKGILGYIKTFIRMLRAFKSGQYQQIPWVTILMIASALIYFVTPIDLIPDFIPVTGFVDDFSLIMAIFSRFKDDIVAFQAWENSVKK